MELKYKEFTEKLKSDLASVDSHVLTCDCCSDCKNQSYLGITDHYLSPDVALQSAILGVYPLDERHSGDYLGQKLTDALETYDVKLSDVTAVVTDGGTNMIKAVQDTVGLSRHVICVAHSSAHVVPDALKPMETLPNIIDGAREIVKAVRRSVVLTDHLKKQQKREGASDGNLLVLLMDTPTRWNSTYEMLRCFVDMKSFVATTLLESNTRLELPRRDEMEMLDEATQLMKPLRDAIIELSGQKYATGGTVIPVTRCVKTTLEKMTPITVTGQQLQEALLKALDKRFRNIEDNEVLAISTILDPRFKRVHFESALSAATVIGKIDRFMKAEARKDRSKPRQVKEPELGAEPSLWDYHEELVTNKVLSADVSSAAFHAELTQYISQGVILRDNDPIQYWKSVGQGFPLLSKVAMKFCNVVGSSVPSERLFSTAGNVVTDSRNRLTGEHVNMLVFLGCVPQHYWDLV
ncbi:zinc finger BED domain-containing protein 1-like [Diachasma alloeum]|uniref:zinc finger BED domain-containing protein 1-like n=1 Tax=Diachasma alloeum TaxID=454923 RepID=UPI0007383326|nr:zinc finger BED domain-containing protein 1-like [Diachasma alloeum]